jgi:hypothetical protein
MTEPCKKKSILPIFLCSLLSLALILTGCATLDKSECINADWYSIGYEDGARGLKTSHIGDHRKACAKHGVAPDFETYEKGRQQGLTEWCTPRNGYSHGSGGNQYNGACPKHMEAAYLKAFNQGKAVHAYENEVMLQDRALKKMYADLNAMDKDIADMEAELIGPGSSPQRRRALLEGLRLREEERRLLLTDISGAEHTINDMRANLQRMRVSNPYR